METNFDAVQPYNKGSWNYMAELKKWVHAGMNLADTGFIDGASGIVNRGCHDPPNCGTGALHAGNPMGSWTPVGLGLFGMGP